jgi:hypothetical protein
LGLRFERIEIVSVAKQFLDGANVAAGLEQAGCKGMTEAVAVRELGEPLLSGSGFERALEHRLVEVMASQLGWALHASEYGARFFAGEHDR